MYSVLRYRQLATGSYFWGVCSNGVTNQPLQTITSAISSIGFAFQTQYGFKPTQTPAQQLLSLPIVYWNETNAVTGALLYSTESDSELVYATSPATAIPQGTVVSDGTDNYYVVLIFTGKMALAKITV